MHFAEDGVARLHLAVQVRNFRALIDVITNGCRFYLSKLLFDLFAITL